MAEPLKLNIGRQRKTVAVSPAEAGYVNSINAQMKLIQENLLKVVDHVDKVTPEALAYGLQPAFEESQRLVPVRTGRLKRSGFLEVRKVSSGAQAAMGYGRYGRPPYAAFVHERVDIPHAGDTSAKFLTIAIANKIDDFRRRVIFFLQRQLPGVRGSG